MGQHNAEFYISSLGLIAHPEGGYFKETFRSEVELSANALPAHFGGMRSASTAIYFLLTTARASSFHRIESDEVWHFYAGDPLEVFGIHPDGRLEVWLLGGPETEGASFQATVPAGIWFGSAVKNTGDPNSDHFSLCGCTVAPGFDFDGFELADRQGLLAEFPQHADLITKLTTG